MTRPVELARLLTSRQLSSGGWSFIGSQQESMEATCLAALALGTEAAANRRAAITLLLKTQLRDGSWPAFQGDSEGSWTTALAVCTLNLTGDFAAQRDNGVRWLLANRGREGHWFWR